MAAFIVAVVRVDREPCAGGTPKILRVWCVYEKCSNCYAGNAQPADPDAR